MKKFAAVVIVMLLAVLGIGFRLYYINTPEYSLKMILSDVESEGMDGLEPHLTGKSEEIFEKINAVSKSKIVNAVIGLLDQNDKISELQTHLSEVNWNIEDVLKSKDKADVILRFSYNDKISGTVKVFMVKEEKEWKISDVDVPEFDNSNEKPI